MEFEFEGRLYRRDEFGVINQVDKKPFKYDSSYINIYNQQKYTQTAKVLNNIRLNYLMSYFFSPPESLLDVGCGNGSFLQACIGKINTLYGFDVVNTMLPDSIIKVYEFVEASVYTFWDSLEHIWDISFLENLPTRMVAVSVPWYYGEFKNWRHYKPDEHIRYFTLDALTNMFEHYGWTLLNYGDVEDVVREPINGNPNILTAIFRK